MKKTIKNAVIKQIIPIFSMYQRGVSMDEISEMVTEVIMDAVNKKRNAEIKELNRIDMELRASKKSCICEENIPKSNIDSKN